MPCTIRPMRPGDLPALYALLSDEEVMRWIEPPYTPAQTERFLQTAGLSARPLIYAVEDAAGAFLGYVIYHDYDSGSMEIGWLLKRDAWGKGCAQALTKQLTARAAAAGKDAVIECAPAQTVTKHIAQKCGFVYQGRRDGCDVYLHKQTQAR